ncbi:MBL fold metallo-hydrolase [Halorubellus litoreus]|uniref:MBL fold metallo-hydrolase n=1 Tax=Halorubellus litoreus TaxID=755308 RepID=A0ABD5VQB9_9EURY
MYRCGSARVNWYLIEDDDALTVIDTGFPTHWQEFLQQLDGLGYDRADIEACPLTHAHPDYTESQVAFYLSDRDVLSWGDALATVDFETWRGNTPQLLPEWWNADHDQARASRSNLRNLGDIRLLAGHGDPWTRDLRNALR